MRLRLLVWRTAVSIVAMLSTAMRIFGGIANNVTCLSVKFWKSVKLCRTKEQLRALYQEMFEYLKRKVCVVISFLLWLRILKSYPKFKKLWIRKWFNACVNQILNTWKILGACNWINIASSEPRLKPSWRVDLFWQTRNFTLVQPNLYFQVLTFVHLWIQRTGAVKLLLKCMRRIALQNRWILTGGISCSPLCFP